MLPRSDIISAVKQIHEWGYPRQLETADADGLWVQAQRADNVVGYFWLVWAEGSVEDALLHVAVNPSFKRYAATRHVLDGFRWAAEFMGAKRVWAPDGFASRLPGFTYRGAGYCALDVR